MTEQVLGGQLDYFVGVIAMNSKKLDDELDSRELTYKELLPLIRRAIISWRVFGFAFVVSVLLTFTVGIVFQVVFLFSLFQGFLFLAMISQPFYSVLRAFTKDQQLPSKLPKPTTSAFLASIIPLFISAFFLFVGIYIFQKTGFCSQSPGCIIVHFIQSSTSSR